MLSILTEFWSLHTLVLWTPRSVILVLYLTSYHLPLIISTNSMVPLLDQKLINILPEQNSSTPSLTLLRSGKTQSCTHLHFKIFFLHQALLQWLACSSQAVDTLHMYSPWLLLMDQILSYSTPEFNGYRLPGKWMNQVWNTILATGQLKRLNSFH